MSGKITQTSKTTTDGLVAPRRDAVTQPTVDTSKIDSVSKTPTTESLSKIDDIPGESQ